jgi:hypothetical protein
MQTSVGVWGIDAGWNEGRIDDYECRTVFVRKMR